MEATVRRRTTRRPITHYWGMLKDLDDSQKLQLVTMLVESVKPAKTEPKKKKLDACDYADIWSDEEYMDADELVNHLNEVRHSKSHRMVMVTENVDDFKNIQGIRIEYWVDRTKK